MALSKINSYSDQIEGSWRNVRIIELRISGFVRHGRNFGETPFMS